MDIKFRHRFEAAHRFLNGSTKCSTPHGHTWWVELTLSHPINAINSSQGFAKDFKDLKSDWKKFIDETMDHSFFCNHHDPLVKALAEITPNSKVFLTPCDPTTEVLAAFMLKKANQIFIEDSQVKPISLKLEETPTNSVSLALEEALEITGSLEMNEFDALKWWT